MIYYLQFWNVVFCLFAGDFAYDMHEVKLHHALVLIN